MLGCKSQKVSLVVQAAIALSEEVTIGHKAMANSKFEDEVCGRIIAGYECDRT